MNYESLTQLIQEQAVYMRLLLGAELEEAIASPAMLQGYQLERGLLGAIQQEVLGQKKGCLPLLQFALTELWEQRDQKTHQLTVAKFKELGDVIGALNRHAEKLYATFTEQEQIWVKRIFLKLVRTVTEHKDTRHRQPKTKLLSMADDNQGSIQTINNVLERLTQERLIVPEIESLDTVVIDLAHEALIENWARLAGWCQEDRELRRLSERVEDALYEWNKEQTDENLMMGSLLSQVREKWQELEQVLDEKARSFYYSSNAKAEQQKLAETFHYIYLSEHYA